MRVQVIFGLWCGAFLAIGNASNVPISPEPAREGHLPFIHQSLVQKLVPTPRKFGSVFEYFVLEFPTILALVSEFGDDVQLPSFFYRGSTNPSEFEFKFRNPRILNASSLSIGASVSERTVTITVLMPSAVFLSSECSYQNLDSSFDPPINILYYEDINCGISDFKMTLSADLTERSFGNYEEPGSLAIENITTSFSVQGCFLSYRNGRRTRENETEEIFSDYKEDCVEELVLGYAEEKDYLSRFIGEHFVNCFLGGNDGLGNGCLWYYRDQSTRHQAFAQILHLLGLAAARKAPEFSKPISEIIDPFVKMNKVLYHYGTFLIQTVKYITFFETWEEDTPNIPDIYSDKTSTNCTGDKDKTSCDTFRNIIWNNGRNTSMNALFETVAFGVVRNYTIDYEYRLPNLVINCKEFSRESENLVAESLLLYEGLELSITNARFGLLGGFTSDENGIIQLVNSDFQFSLSQATTYIPTVISYEQGRREDLPPIMVDLATEIVSVWESIDENGVKFHQRYSEYLEKIINDFLAGKISI